MMPTSSHSIRLLLMDNHTLFRESLRRMLDGEHGIKVVGDYSSAESALSALAKGLMFDVALLDYDLGRAEMNGVSGLDLAVEVRRTMPKVPILMVTAGMDIAELRRAIGQLHVGVFLKTEPTGELLLAIQKMARGEQWISSRASLALLSDQATSQTEREERGTLSERESRVLQSVLEGETNKEIGVRLGMTESSVKAVLQKLFEKTGVRSRSQLVRYAIESHIDTRGARRE
jgi:DNA-binding NarL/FixJ family response regulator